MGVLASFIVAAVAGLPNGAAAADRSIEAVSVCEVVAKPDDFVGRELMVIGQITDLGSHGHYTYANACPDAYLIVYPSRDGIEGIVKQMALVSRRPGSESTAPALAYRVRVHLKDYRLWGTTSVSKRLMLEIIEIPNPSPAR